MGTRGLYSKIPLHFFISDSTAKIKLATLKFLCNQFMKTFITMQYWESNTVKNSGHLRGN